MRRQMDEVARQRRELDIAIQAVNWTTDLANKRSSNKHEQVARENIVANASAMAHSYGDLCVSGQHTGLNPVLSLAQHRDTGIGHGVS